MDNGVLVDELISHLYRSAPSIRPDQYRAWALEQVAKVIDFDAAFWGAGNQTNLHFHYVEQIGLDERYVAQLEATIDINPIKDEVLKHLDKPIDMADVMPDEVFYRSALYQTLFQPYGIERILAAGHLEQKSGLYSLISLYRFDREQTFSAEEKSLQQKLIYHLVSALSHAYFLHLNVDLTHTGKHLLQQTAICDFEGCFHEVQPRFLSLLEKHLPQPPPYRLPIHLLKALIDSEQSVDPIGIESHGLMFELTRFGNLIKVFVRAIGPLDLLSEREKQIVLLVCKGLTFKEIAKTLSLSPSTVSNHLYRVYDKLRIRSRTELAQLVMQENA